MLFFTHLLILEDPDHHQNLISSSLYYQGPLHIICYQYVHNCLSNVVHKQIDRQTNATKNITFFSQGGNKVFYALLYTPVAYRYSNMFILLAHITDRSVI